MTDMFIQRPFHLVVPLSPGMQATVCYLTGEFTVISTVIYSLGGWMETSGFRIMEHDLLDRPDPSSPMSRPLK